jgi:HPt (histidine-containing phosphotransfer) domain-containing protein
MNMPVQTTAPYVCPYTVGEIDVPPELVSVVDGYIARREAEIGQLRSFIAADNFGGVARIAHKLEGNGASYGFFVLSEIARDMQTQIRNAHYEALPTLIDNLQEILREIKRRMMKN